MKNLKQIIFVFAVLTLLSFTINAQTSQIPPDGNSTILEVPDSVKSLEKYSDNNLENYIFETRYFKKINAFITIIYDKNRKIISVNIPKSIPSYTTKNSPSGVQSCNENTSGWNWVTCMIDVLLK